MTDVLAPATTSATSGRMEAHELARLLPHRWPFLMLDRVLTVEPGRRLVAMRCISQGDWSLAGHFPGNPIAPGVLLIESAAQAAGVYLALDSGQGLASGIGYLVGVKRFRFRAVVRPGDSVTIEVSPSGGSRATLHEFRAVLRVDGVTVAEGTLSIAFDATTATAMPSVHEGDRS